MKPEKLNDQQVATCWSLIASALAHLRIKKVNGRLVDAGDVPGFDKWAISDKGKAYMKPYLDGRDVQGLPQPVSLVFRELLQLPRVVPFKRKGKPHLGFTTKPSKQQLAYALQKGWL